MDHVLKHGLVSRTGRRSARDAGISKDNVECPEIFGQGCEEPLAVFRKGNVSAVATRVWSEFCNGLIQRFLVATGNGDLGALSNEKSGCDKTFATVTAGNKSLLACELDNA